jgi:hypothetical protein
LDTEYQVASRRPISDVVSRGAAAVLLAQMNATAGKLNAVYDDWQRTLSDHPASADYRTVPADLLVYWQMGLRISDTTAAHPHS